MVMTLGLIESVCGAIQIEDSRTNFELLLPRSAKMNAKTVSGIVLTLLFGISLFFIIGASSTQDTPQEVSYPIDCRKNPLHEECTSSGCSEILIGPNMCMEATPEFDE